MLHTKVLEANFTSGVQWEVDLQRGLQSIGEGVKDVQSKPDTISNGPPGGQNRVEGYNRIFRACDIAANVLFSGTADCGGRT